MLARLRHPDLQPIVAALFAVAMIWLGFGHRPVAAYAGLPVEMVGLADGSVGLSALCSAEKTDIPRGLPHAGTFHCDACLIGVEPKPQGLTGRSAPSVPGLGPVVAASDEVAPRRLASRPPSRAPPAVV
jgi:hypothetical protein